MKPAKYFISIIFSLLLLSCDETGTNSGNTVVGSPQDTQISNLSFSVDTTYLDVSASRLVAKGSVKNNGNAHVNSPWYVEGQFYTDAAYSTKIGGNTTKIGVPLSKGQSTLWTLYYSSSSINVNSYPDFGIGDLRGIYK